MGYTDTEIQDAILGAFATGEKSRAKLLSLLAQINENKVVKNLNFLRRTGKVECYRYGNTNENFPLMYNLVR